MSKTLRYDSLLARALATELERRLAGARIRAIRFDVSERTLRIATGRGTLTWDLRAQPGGLRLAPVAHETGNTPVLAGSRIAAIRALPDERIVEIAIDGARDQAGRTGAQRIVIELFGAHANAIAVDVQGAIVAALRPGTRDRPANRGEAYDPPEPSGRLGLESPLDLETFRVLLAGIPEGERERALIRRVAWVSPINAGAILGPALTEWDESALTEAWRRYCTVAHGPDRPVFLLDEDGGQPYPRPLPGERSEPIPDLVTGFERLAAEPAAGTTREAALVAIEARVQAIRRRVERLHAQMAGATAEAATLRRSADLLLSHAHALRRGLSEALLDDHAGGVLRVDLDPSLDPAGNAERMYAQARRRNRAAQRIPGLLREAELEESRLAGIAERVRAGGAAVEATLWAELTGGRPAGGPPSPALPYRRYRSRGGLEIRVGRGARANDELTLRHSRPDDIWLHARDAAGAHVVLVWGRREQNPPESDLIDAAVLAALHSRARTSKTVPVDWTRRKYVRKPRKAPPGTVVLERGRTLFVEPDPVAGERLRHPGLQL